jgi:hypothetical protein
MRPVDSQGGNTSDGLAAGFAARPPSQSWERVAFSDDPQSFLWVWFKPRGVPHGLVVRLPDEAWQNHPQAGQWTMRRLLQPTGVEPQSVSLWQLDGVAYDGMQGTSPLFDQAIPSPSPGMDPSIFVYVNVPPVDPMQYAAPPPIANVGSDLETLERIEADWNAILETENEVKGLRKNLIDMASRLKTLNRDLSFEEREHADSMDTRDWRDARRALRDASLRLSVCLKEVDIGDVSSAGQKAWFEQIYRQFVVPRLEFENMQQAEISFTYQRKMIAMLQNNMNSVMLHAANYGERPAQKILNRIAAKIRDAQTRRNFLGVMLD